MLTNHKIVVLHRDRRHRVEARLSLVRLSTACYTPLRHFVVLSLAYLYTLYSFCDFTHQSPIWGPRSVNWCSLHRGEIQPYIHSHFCPRYTSVPDAQKKHPHAHHNRFLDCTFVTKVHSKAIFPIPELWLQSHVSLGPKKSNSSRERPSTQHNPQMQTQSTTRNLTSDVNTSSSQLGH
jgi:hypothetical protein